MTRDLMTDDLIGTTLGKYTIRKLLGEGGLGRVYLAHETLLDREVALKVLKPFLSGNPDLQKRFLKEAVAMAKLNHPNIIQIYALEQERGRMYFVMEYLRGEPLSAVIRRGPLAPAAALRIVRAVAAALDYAHRQGVLHRDIKSSNLMFGDGGQVKVLDFGLAAVATEATMLTNPGDIIGTPHYMAPEQALGKKADPRSDLYSLGIVCYELLTGHLPFRADTPLAVLHQQVNIPLPPVAKEVPGIDIELERILWKLTAKEPDDRFPSAAVLLETIEHYAEVPRDTPATPLPGMLPVFLPPRPAPAPAPSGFAPSPVSAASATPSRPEPEPPPSSAIRAAGDPSKLLSLALKNYHSGLVAHAMRNLDELEATGKAGYEAWKLRATILLKSGKPHEAMSAYREAAAFTSAEPDLLNNLGVLYQKDRQPGEARAMFELALRRHPRYGMARLNLANLLKGAGDFTGALREVNTLLGHEPGNATARALKRQLLEALQA